MAGKDLSRLKLVKMQFPIWKSCCCCLKPFLPGIVKWIPNCWFESTFTSRKHLVCGPTELRKRVEIQKIQTQIQLQGSKVQLQGKLVWNTFYGVQPRWWARVVYLLCLSDHRQRHHHHHHRRHLHHHHRKHHRMWRFDLKDHKNWWMMNVVPNDIDWRKS